MSLYYPHIFIDNNWNPLLERQQKAYNKCVEYIDTRYRPSAFGAAGTKKPIVIPTQFITVTNVPNDEKQIKIKYSFYIVDNGTDYYGTYYYIQINGFYYKIENFKRLPDAFEPLDAKSLQKVTADNISIDLEKEFSGPPFHVRQSSSGKSGGGRKYNYKTKTRNLKLYNNKSRKSRKSRK
jgi:hypothetical protein